MYEVRKAVVFYGEAQAVSSVCVLDLEIIAFREYVCPLSFRKELQKLIIGFEKYRKIYSLDRQYGIERIKYGFVKHRLEGVLLRFGPLFLRVVRGE